MGDGAVVRQTFRRWSVRAGVLFIALATLAPQTVRAQCSAIACGQTLAGFIGVGETDCFEFTADANERVSIATQETSGAISACWRLVAPGDTVLATVCGQGEAPPLPTPGTYTIEVFDNGDDATGAYDVNLVFISDTTSNCGAPINCGDTLAGNVAAVAESDTFTFAALEADTVSITVQETGGGVSGCWELYDPTGASLGGVCGQDEKTLAVDGNYTIRVYDSANANTGTYDVNLVFVSESPSVCAEPIACGQTLVRGTATVAESDTFVFQSGAGETVSITAQETGGGTATCWDLYDPAGIEIASACGQGEHALADAGQYTIRAYDDNDSQTGSYDLSLVFVSDTSSNCAEPISCGQPLAREVTLVGESDTYRFTAVAGDTVSITSQETSAFLNPCWEIYDPEGISVVGACGQGQKTLAVPGDYTIRVSDNGNIETGTYNLDLVVVSDTASSCAEAIACGDTFARDLATVGESDTFRFFAAAGEAVSVTAQETGGFVATCWEIYDPEGISLGGTCGQTEKTLAVAGGYTVRVYDNNDLETGTYAVNLVVVSDTANACATPLACGELAVGSITLKGESDTYRIAGQTGDVVAIETTEVGGFINACWEFYDPSGASLGGVCGKADRTLATDLGGYTLRVYDSGDNDPGDYQVGLCNPTTTTTTVFSGSTTTTTLGGGGDVPVAGRLLLLKDSPNAQKRRLVLVSKDPTVTIGQGQGSGDDPTQHGGSLRVRSLSAGFDATYDLEPIGWRLLKKRDPAKGWKYNKGNAIKLAVLKNGKVLRIVGRGAALQHALAMDPNPVAVAFALGARRYCMEFGGAPKFTAGKSFSARDAAAPVKCADPAP